MTKKEKQTICNKRITNKYFDLFNSMVEENSTWLNDKLNFKDKFISNNIIVNNTLISIVE